MVENHTRFKTIMVKIYTRFQTKTALKPYPFGRHIPHTPGAQSTAHQENWVS